VVSNAFDFHAVRFTFSEDVSASLLTDDLVLSNLTTRTTFRPDELSVTYDRPTNTASFRLRSGLLPDGNYAASLSSAGVSDAAGNTLTGTNTGLEFYVLQGDFNRDRSVNGSDFAILAGNFGRGGQLYVTGDITGDGSVNGSDFAILAGNFGKTLLAQLGAASATATLAVAPAAAPAVVPTPAPVAAKASTKPAKKTKPVSRRGEVMQPLSRRDRTPRGPAAVRRR
jgi:hypothetical protein